jgi:hypothetical protein
MIYGFCQEIQKKRELIKEKNEGYALRKKIKEE